MTPARAISPVRAIVTAWLVAGTLDIGTALVYYPLTVGASPVGILQGIAAGLLGASAFDGGAGAAALGLACHYFLALVWTVFFFLVYPRIAILARSRVATGVLYGVLVSTVMNFVVLPLSRVGPRPFRLRAFLIATVILILAIGLPIAFILGGFRARWQKAESS